MKGLEFNEALHEYRLGGERLPSITSVLPYNYNGGNTEAMDRGTAVHRACYHLNMKQEGEIYTDPIILSYLHSEGFMNYIEAFICFRKEHKISGIYDIKTGSPHPCTELQLAAQWLLATEGLCCDGKKAEQTYEMPMYHPHYRFAGTPDIVDIGYDSNNNAIIGGLYALYLSENGTYKLSNNYIKDARRNSQIFLSFLTVYSWKKARGLQ